MNEMTGGRAFDNSSEPSTFENPLGLCKDSWLRALAEDVLQGKRNMTTDKDILSVREQCADSAAGSHSEEE